MLQSNFFNKLLTLGIPFSILVGGAVVAKFLILGISPITLFILTLREALVAKLVIIGISHLTSFSLVLREALAAKLVISSILSAIFLTLALYTSVLTISSFLNHLVYLRQLRRY